MLGVTEGDPDRGNSALFREFLRGTFENNERLPTRFAVHINVLPSHCLSDAGAESFRDGFFRREARRQMARGIFHRLGILDLARRKNAVEKTVAETIQRMLDARVLHQIDPNAEHTHDRKPKMNKESRKTGTQKLILVLASWLPDSIPFLRSCFPD